MCQNALEPDIHTYRHQRYAKAFAQAFNPSRTWYWIFSVLRPWIYFSLSWECIGLPSGLTRLVVYVWSAFLLHPEIMSFSLSFDCVLFVKIKRVDLALEMEFNTAALSSDESEFGWDQQQKWPG